MEVPLIQRAKAAPAGNAPLLEWSDLCGVLVRLDVEGSKALFIRLTSDGRIERLGATGRDILDGIATPELFLHLIRKVSPQLLRWMGQSWSDPAPKGKRCLLVVGFRQCDGQETLMRWEYGSDSYEPPPEVLEFVMSAAEVTRPWLGEQKAPGRPLKHRQPQEAGWHLVPLLPA